MTSFLDAKGIMDMLPLPNVTPSVTQTPTSAPVIVTLPPNPPGWSCDSWGPGGRNTCCAQKWQAQEKSDFYRDPACAGYEPPMLPPTITTPPPPPPPPAPQPPFVIVQPPPAEERPPPPPPPYPYPPVYGPGYPGLNGAIQTFPGMAQDASIKIGSISNSVGNTNIGDGTQSFGTVPGSTDVPGMIQPTSGPMTPTFAPPPILSFAPMPPMPFPEPPSMPEESSSKWPLIVVSICMLISLGVAGYLLWKRYSSGKKNNSNKRGNAGGGAATNNTNLNNTNARNTGENFGANNNIGGEDNFGDFDTETPTAPTR